MQHLCFECSLSAEVWQKVLLILGIARGSTGFSRELEIVAKRSKKTGIISKLYVMCFTEAVYHIWLHRNSVVFRNSVNLVHSLAKEIMFKVSCNSSDELRERLMSC